MRLVRVATPLLVLMLAARIAHATPTTRLSYIRGPGAQQDCPDETEFRRAVGERLGYDPFSRTASQTIIVSIARKDARFRAELKIVDEAGATVGERHLPAETRECAEVVKSLALAVSIVLDSLDVVSGVPNEQAREPKPTQPAQAPESAPPTSTARAAGRPRVGASVAAGILGGVRSAPAPAMGGWLDARVIGLSWSVGLGARLDLPASETIAHTTNGSIQTALALGLVDVCLWTGHAWRPFACALGAIGSFSGEAHDVTAPSSARALFAGVGARFGAEVGLAGPVYMLGRVDILGTLTPHRTLVSGAAVFSLPVFSGAAAIGVGARFL